MALHNHGDPLIEVTLLKDDLNSSMTMILDKGKAHVEITKTDVKHSMNHGQGDPLFQEALYHGAAQKAVHLECSGKKGDPATDFVLEAWNSLADMNVGTEDLHPVVYDDTTSKKQGDPLMKDIVRTLS
jgi:hypothetical protein